MSMRGKDEHYYTKTAVWHLAPDYRLIIHNKYILPENGQLLV
jgi:hypothetical protein